MQFPGLGGYVAYRCLPNPRVDESNQVVTGAGRCDLPHLATSKTAHPGPRSLLRLFPVVAQDARRPPTVWTLERAGLGNCARRLFRRALRCGADLLGFG